MEFNYILYLIIQIPLYYYFCSFLYIINVIPWNHLHGHHMRHLRIQQFFLCIPRQHTRTLKIRCLLYTGFHVHTHYLRYTQNHSQGPQCILRQNIHTYTLRTCYWPITTVSILHSHHPSLASHRALLY